MLSMVATTPLHQLEQVYLKHLKRDLLTNWED